jgi:hypothetical protein
MMPDYEARPTVVLAKKGEEYAKDAASGKIAEKAGQKNLSSPSARRNGRPLRPSGKSRRESRRSADSERVGFFVFTFVIFYIVLS